MAPPRTVTRGSFEANAATNAAKGAPYRRQHEASTLARWERHPQRLHDLVRELRDAWEAEIVVRIHERPFDGGGTPRWTVAFRSYITGPDCETTKDGDWRWPLRSSLFRLSISRSATDRLAAAFCWLLIHHRYSVREAWAVQCGVLADPAIADAAEAWAGEALTRWWRYFAEQPMGKVL